MDPVALGQLTGSLLVSALIAVLVVLFVREVIRIVRYNVIKKQHGEEAAKAFWNARKNRSKSK